MNQLAPISARSFLVIVAAAGEGAQLRFLEFFAASIRKAPRRLRRLRPHCIIHRRSVS